MIKAEMPHGSTLICEYRSPGLRPTNVPGASTIAFKVNRRGWIRCRVGFSSAWRREVTPS